jgi:DNA-binding protein H-NS
VIFSFYRIFLESTMSHYHELLNQIAQLNQQAEAIRRQEIGGIVTEIRQLMAQYQLTAADLGFFSETPRMKATRAPVPPKYRDPMSGKTWSGRGLAPKWVAALAEQGKTLEDCRI